MFIARQAPPVWIRFLESLRVNGRVIRGGTASEDRAKILIAGNYLGCNGPREGRHDGARKHARWLFSTRATERKSYRKSRVDPSGREGV